MNSEKNRSATPVHECVLKCRAHIDVTGVREVTSFDESEVILITDCGEMSIEGSELRVGTLDTGCGVVAVDGKISAVYYSDNTPKRRRGFFARGGEV